MDFQKALQLKASIATNLISKLALKKSRVYTMAARSSGAVATNLLSSINGVGVAEKVDGESFVRVLTREKVSLDSAAMARYFNVKPAEIAVEYAGPIRFKSARRRHRPAFPGISIGHPDITAGTLGCYVADERNREYILSNNHVLANTDQAYYDDAILQPGVLDNGVNDADAIARLRYTVPLSSTAPNYLDAAIALRNYDIPVDYRINKKFAVNGIAAVKNRMKVEKYGRTTGHTIGTISARSLDISIDFDGTLMEFQDQIEIKGTRTKPMFCDGGDSGSLILERGSHKAVALLFAGTDDGITFATPIQLVLDSFGVRIL